MSARTKLVARNKRRTILRLLLVLLILLLIAAGVVGVVWLLTRDSTPTLSPTELPVPADSGYVPTGNGLLYRTSDGVAYYDFSDEDRNYEAPVNAADTRLLGSGDTHAVYNAAALQVIGAEYPLSLSGTIVDADLSAAHIAVLRADAGGAEDVLIFDTDGLQKDQLAFSTQYIVDFGFHTAKNEYFWVETLDTRMGTPVTGIHLYNMTLGSTSGLLQVQNQLIEKVYFTDSSIFLIGTNQIIRYALENNREAYRETVYGWKLVDCAGGTFLLMPRSAEQYGSLKLLRCEEGEYSGAKELILQAPAGTKNAFVMGDRLCMVAGDMLHYYSFEGKLLSEARLPAAADNAVKLSGNQLLIESGGGLSLVKIR